MNGVIIKVDYIPCLNCGTPVKVQPEWREERGYDSKDEGLCGECREVKHNEVRL